MAQWITCCSLSIKKYVLPLVVKQPHQVVEHRLATVTHRPPKTHKRPIIGKTQNAKNKYCNLQIDSNICSRMHRSTGSMCSAV